MRRLWIYLLWPAERGGSIDGELLVSRELGDAADAQAAEQQESAARRPRDLCRQPRFIVHLASLERGGRALVYAGEQAEAERQIVDGLDLDAHDLVIRFADPRERLEILHDLAVIGLRLDARPQIG